MTSDRNDAVRAAADRVIELEKEVETIGHASVEQAALERARSILHQWVDEVTGVVVSPGLGRVTLIHGSGRQSTIASPDLPFRMSAPVRRHQGS
jgi:hypothetical protein